MVNLVLSSKLLSQVKTAYLINSKHENGRIGLKVNKI